MQQHSTAQTIKIGLSICFKKWGFRKHGVKRTAAGEENVYVRDFSPTTAGKRPKQAFPYIGREARKFIVPIYPEYHTELLPNSVLRTKSPFDFIENRPNRNAISKVYISRSVFRDLKAGDIIVFYRTAAGGPAYYTFVATTIGVVESVHVNIKSFRKTS